MTGMWLAAGRWKCISQKFKEICRVWGIFKSPAKTLWSQGEAHLQFHHKPTGATWEKLMFTFCCQETRCFHSFASVCSLSKVSLNCLCSQANWCSQPNILPLALSYHSDSCLSQLQGGKRFEGESNTPDRDICNFRIIYATLNSIFTHVIMLGNNIKLMCHKCSQSTAVTCDYIIVQVLIKSIRADDKWKVANSEL